MLSNSESAKKALSLGVKLDLINEMLTATRECEQTELLATFPQNLWWHYIFCPFSPWYVSLLDNLILDSWLLIKDRHLCLSRWSRRGQPTMEDEVQGF